MAIKDHSCPHCKRSEEVVRFGFTGGGRQRLRCKACRKTWTPESPGRCISTEKEALIEKALEERLSQRAIARMLGCGRNTVAKVLKKVYKEPPELLQNNPLCHQRRCFGDR